MPTQLRRYAKKANEIRKCGRTYQLSGLWWRCHAQSRMSVSSPSPSRTFRHASGRAERSQVRLQALAVGRRPFEADEAIGAHQ